MLKINIAAIKNSIKNMTKLFMILIIPALIIAPYVLGVIESRINVDMTGNGRCRLDNTMQVLLTKDKSTRIINGFVKAEGKEYGHTWGVTSTGKIIDVTCDDSFIDYRRPVEIINPWNATMPVVKDNSKSAWDKICGLWNRAYLVGFVAYKRISVEV